MKKRQPVNIFSLSFLDVFACAVGVIVMVMMLVVLQSINSVDASTRDRFDEAVRLETRQQELQDKAEQYAEAAEEYDRVSGEISKSQDAKKSLAQEVAEAEKSVKKLIDDISRIDDLKEEAERTKRKVAAVSSEIREGQFDKQLVVRKPALRTTNKSNDVIIVFAEGSVRYIENNLNAPTYLRSDHYNKSIDGPIITMTMNGRSESLSEMLTAGGNLARLLGKYDRSKSFIECVISPGQTDFDNYVTAREYLYSAGWELAPSFNDEPEKIMFSAFGQAAKVQ